MIPRTGTHDWGTHIVNSQDLRISTRVDPNTGAVDFGGMFRTIKTLLDNDGNVISQERGPNVFLRGLEPTDTVTLDSGKVISVGEIVEAITRFYSLKYDRDYQEFLDSQIPEE